MTATPLSTPAEPRRDTRIWDPFVRLFHWTLVGCFAANALFTNPEHTLHHMIGFTVVGLVLARVLWGLIGTRHARFSDFPPSVSGAVEQLSEIVRGRRHVHAGHSPLGALMIYNLIVTLLVIGFSGWLMTTDTYWGVQWPEDLHKAAVTWAEVSVLAHVAAVFLESLRLRINLPRGMITGYKSLPVNDTDNGR